VRVDYAQAEATVRVDLPIGANTGSVCSPFVSLAIDVDHVTEVLLADGWHIVAEQSFTLDSYEYIWWPPNASRHPGDAEMMDRPRSGQVNFRTPRL
jgi:hypothetical protein